MGLFGTSNDTAAIDEVETATSEKSTEEDWGQIINICDKAGKSPEDAKLYLKLIIKRLNNPDPHVGIKAVTLLDACIKNSGKKFHIEVASREFETEFTKLMSKGHKTVAKKLRESLKRWAENEFKSDSQLTLIPSLYSKLKSSGFDFTIAEAPKKPAPICKDPNVVETQEEEEQILRAIELSLKETSGTGNAEKTIGNTSLYPSVNMAAAGVNNAVSSAPVVVKEPRKVRALYDFEAVEDNELTFNSGEIIVVLDDSDANWWKGSNHRGEGLFPANFVTADLSEKPKKNVQFNETEPVVKVIEKTESDEIEINEDKINRLLHLLHEADPTNPEHDTEEMLKLEREVNGMGPLIDAELERVDRKHAELTKLSSDLVQALSLYHTLMGEPQFQPVNKMMYNFPPQAAPNPMPFNNMAPPPHSMGPPHDRPPFIPQNIPPQHYAASMGMMHRMSAPHMGPQPGMVPQQQPQQQQPQGSMSGPPSLPDHFTGYVPPGIPSNFAPPPPPGSQPGGIQNGQQQQQHPLPPPQQQGPPPHFVVNKSSHIMH